jgi:hypothetical protein
MIKSEKLMGYMKGGLLKCSKARDLSGLVPARFQSF